MNPIDTTIFKFRKKEIASKKLKLDSNYEYLLYVGRLSKNKGIEELLLTFNKLDTTNLTLTIERL